jgi:hypothetical protein
MDLKEMKVLCVAQDSVYWWALMHISKGDLNVPDDGIFIYFVGWDLTPIRSLCRSPRFV